MRKLSNNLEDHEHSYLMSHPMCLENSVRFSGKHKQNFER